MTHPLRAVAPDLWDHRMHLRTVGPLWVPRRMVVARLEDGSLWLHSPNALTPELRAALDALGPVRALVGPSLMHAAFLGDYLAAYPEAKLYGAPGFGRVHPELPAEELELASYPWADELEHLLTAGVPRLNEVAFFHRASKTLLLTDFAHNVGPNNPLLTRLLFRWIRGYGRLGPTDYFRGLVEDRAAVWRSIEAICSRWAFERVLVSHGEAADAGPAELRAAFEAYRPEA